MDYRIISKEWVVKDEFRADVSRMAELFSGYVSPRSSGLGFWIVYENNEYYCQWYFADESTVDGYFDKYPSAKDEPLERVPWYYFNPSLAGGEKWNSIASTEIRCPEICMVEILVDYLTRNPEKLVVIDDSVVLGLEQFLEVRQFVRKGWGGVEDDLLDIIFSKSIV